MNTLSVETFESHLQAKDAFVVDFYADWCQACIDMMPVVEEVAAESSVPFYKVNVDALPELKDRAKIKAIPMLLMFKDGRMQEFVYGTSTKEKILQKLSRIV